MVYFLDCWFWSIIRSEFDLKFSWLFDNIILASVLISESVSSNDDRFGPAWHESWDIGDDDWLSENGTIKDIPNCSVWRLPLLFQIEFRYTTSIWCDSSTLDSNLMFFGCFSSVNCDLIICRVTRSHAQIIVFSLEINVRMDMLSIELVSRVKKNLLYPWSIAR